VPACRRGRAQVLAQGALETSLFPADKSIPNSTLISASCGVEINRLERRWRACILCTSACH
jgi:hypothetical protein